MTEYARHRKEILKFISQYLTSYLKYIALTLYIEIDNN